MEGLTATAYKGVKGYWMRSGYEKLNGKGRRRKSEVELGRRRRFWRIRLSPRLKLKLRFSPKKFILGLRDAYVNLMTRLATTRFINSGVAGYPGEGINGFGVRPLKEYDEKMIIEIYKSLVMAQGGQLVTPTPRVASKNIATLPTMQVALLHKRLRDKTMRDAFSFFPGVNTEQRQLEASTTTQATGPGVNIVEESNKSPISDVSG